MTKSRGLSLAICTRITSAEAEHGVTLSDTDRSLLFDVTFSTVDDLISKFVLGAKTHGGSLFDRNLPDELNAELLDAIIYSKANKIKMQKLFGTNSK